MRAADEVERRQFDAWASQSLHPLAAIGPGGASNAELAPLKRMIGSAKVVALSEAGHGGAEPLLFRNRLLKYLVEELGFTAIAIESGVTEGQTVHDYVLGGPADLKSVMKMGIGWTFDTLPQNEALVKWLREYNTMPHHARKVNFYGFDVPGSPGNPGAGRHLTTAIEGALDYLVVVDNSAAVDLRRRIKPQLPFLDYGTGLADLFRYAQLPTMERDQLTAAIADLVALFERRAALYIAASSAEAYQWGYRNAICARQVDTWLRQMPENWKVQPDPVFQRMHAVRNRAMVDNLRWVEEQEGPQGKILVFAARFHTSAALYTPAVAGQPELGYPMGWYLRKDLGADFVSIGNFVGGGSVGCGRAQIKITPSASSIDTVLSAQSGSDFLLDLRTAPAAIRSWLDQPKEIFFPPNGLKVPIWSAFDIVYVNRTSTPACPQ